MFLADLIMPRSVAFHHQIMIVEDDRRSAEGMLTSLRKCGYKNILHCQDGQEALRNLNRFSPDLVIVNQELQGEWNGLEVSRKINNVKYCKVLFTTSEPEKLEAQLGSGEDNKHILGKPYKNGELTSMLRFI